MNAKFNVDASLTYTCSHELDPTVQGYREVSVVATDPAGNRGSASIGITFDYDGPQPTLVEVFPALAAAGSEVVLTLSFDERVDLSDTAPEVAPTPTLAAGALSTLRESPVPKIASTITPRRGARQRGPSSSSPTTSATS